MRYKIPPETTDQQDTRTRPPTHPVKLLRKPRTLIAVFSVLGLLILTGTVLMFLYIIQLTRTTEMTVVLGGEARTVNTRARTVEQLLEMQNFTLAEGDVLSVDPDTPVQDGLVVQLERARPVTLLIDDQPRVLRTIQTNPASILAEAGIAVAPDDRIILDGTRADSSTLVTWPVPVNQIQIIRAVSVTVIDGDTQQTIRTTGQTVGEALFDADVTLFLADETDPPVNTPINSDMTIRVERSQPATIIADGVSLETRTRGDTVGDLIADSGLTLMGLDYSIPGETAAVQAGMTVRVIRVTEEILSEYETIPFESISQPDPALELDQVRLVQSGESGVLNHTTRIRYENGIEVSRVLEGTAVIQEPTNRIVAYGTGIVIRTVDTEDGPREYWRKLSLLTTSYHPEALGGDNITATGQILTKGIVGVDPTVIPYGTEVYVPGYGIGVAADTGPPRSTRLWIDLGYDDENFVPWSQYTDVYILAPIPDRIPYILPD